MLKQAVITLCIGHLDYWGATIPLLQSYANKIGVNFHAITQIRSPPKYPHHPKLGKFHLYDFLQEYDRLLFLDSDIVVHPNCPNLFELVEEHTLGVVCESPPHFHRDAVFQEACQYYGVSYPGEAKDWFNTGVMVISKRHQALFAWPARLRSFSARNLDGSLAPPRFRWWDMPLLNCERSRLNLEIKNLGYRYNYLQPLIHLDNSPFPPEKAFIFHGCGEDKSRLYQMIKTWHNT